MKASEAQLLAFLRKSSQFVIPIYQRTYSWTEKECQQLWNDIIRAGNDEAVSVHFVGSIVYIEEGLNQVTQNASLLVIDGQQRLTSITLLLAALANVLDDSEPVPDFSKSKVRNRYLVDPEETGDRHHKLLLSQTDKETSTAIVSNEELPEDISIRVSENFALFKKWITAQGSDLAVICKGLAKLMVVDIALNRDHDNPQLIFESMNSTGRELSQADLIRNFILMGLETELQTRLYEKYWRPMELAFGQEAYSTHFDSFMRHYLTVKTSVIPRMDGIYEAYKDHARSPKTAAAGVEALVKDIRDYAKYYCVMALGSEEDKNLKLAFHDLRELKVDVAYPFLLELYSDYTLENLSSDDFLEAVRLVEAYVFRRAICTIPTNSLNKTFSTFGKVLKKDRYLESIKAHFLTMPSYRRFPRDEEFQRDIKTRDLYSFRSRSYWLRRFENHERKERVPVDEYTIEHIMPQKENLTPEWQEELGPEWERVHDMWLHTLGNLTLTGYNSEYGCKPFSDKRDMDGGFRDSPLRVNKGLGAVETWNEEAIETRAKNLASLMPNVWPMPELSADIIAAYQPETTTSTNYSIEDHPHLQTPAIREIFEAFSKEVFALDPCVSQEFLKLYVAFKAETNFVDVVPQAKRLRLSLNMAFADINDPNGICKDVTSVGRWGNGDIEVGLDSLDEIPYVIGLVRQSLERQLGDGGDE